MEKKKKPKKKKLYFGDEVDQAIRDFQKAKTKEEKNKIFVATIMPAFEQLVSYYFVKDPKLTNDEVMQDCMTHLYENIGKFNTEKYDRGFPYFNMVTKHFFIKKKKDLSKEIVKDSKTISNFWSESVLQTGDLVFDLEKELEKKEFMDLFKKNLTSWREVAKKDQEKKFIDALITLFEDAENLPNHKKKAVFHYIREITGLNSKQIASNISKLKKRFRIFKKKYHKGRI